MSEPRSARFLSLNVASVLALVVGPFAYLYAWQPWRMAAVLVAAPVALWAVDIVVELTGSGESPLATAAGFVAGLALSIAVLLDVRRQVIRLNRERFPDRAPDGGAWGARGFVTLAIASVGFLVLMRQVVVEARRIPSESMWPTLAVGDRVLVDKLSYGFRAPARGELVLFSPPERALGGGDNFLKRVVALPGERVAIKAGKVIVDGRALAEPYAAEGIRYAEPDWPRLGMPGGQVPPGMLFVLGDNRNNSNDSHVYGPVALERVVGRVAFRFAPEERMGAL